MMRFQRLTPDILPISNGKKQSSERLSSFTSSPSSFNPKPLRPRSKSASTTPDRPPFPHFPIPSASGHHLDTKPASSASPLKIQPHNDTTAAACSTAAAGSTLLQWGQKKRSRVARATAAAAADDSASASASGSHSRQVIKIQRRPSSGAKKPAAAAAAMPPPGASYTRGAKLRPCSSVRDATSALLSSRGVEEQSVGHPRSEKRSPASPPEKAAAPAVPNAGDEPSKQPVEHQKGGNGGGGAQEKVNLENFELPRIFIGLSRKEKEEDFMAMKGAKLPQRPKRRPKNIERSLQYCFPGMWLSDLTRARYEVRVKKCAKKKKRGLKGMESMDSDSE